MEGLRDERPTARHLFRAKVLEYPEAAPRSVVAKHAATDKPDDEKDREGK